MSANPQPDTSLIYTSADDAKSSLIHRHDIAVLKVTAEACEAKGHKTKATLIRRRVRQLEKAQSQS